MEREYRRIVKLVATIKSECQPNMIPPLVPLAGKLLKSLNLLPKTSVASRGVMCASFIS
jgi:hypothetical protein